MIRITRFAGANMAGWSDDETLKLIDIWGEDTIQAQLEGCKRNKMVYDRIARQLTADGHAIRADQCRVKVKKLKGEYRKIKDKDNKVSTRRKQWKFLEAIDQVLGDKPACNQATNVD